MRPRAFEVGVAGVLLAVGAGCAGDDGASAEPSDVSAVAPHSAAVGGILDRESQVTAWTEDGLFVYGGRLGPTQPEPVGGAALVDPDTGVVQPLPEPPFAVPLENHAVAATVGTDVFLLGELCARHVEVSDTTSACEPGGLAAAVYSLDTESWRPVEIPEPLAAVGPEYSWINNLLGVTGDGRIVLDLLPGGQREVGDAPFWTYDPGTDEWTQLGDPAVRVEDACLAGNRLVVSSSVLVGDGAEISVTLDVLSLDEPTSQWVSEPPLRAMIWGPGTSCGDDFAVVYSRSYQQGTFLQSVDPLDVGDWVELPSAPLDLIEFSERLWTGERLVLFDEEVAHAAALDPVAGSWVSVALPVWQGFPVWTGERMVGIDPNSPNGIFTVSLPG